MAATTAKLPMMKGSSGKKDYLAVAHKGDIFLGIKVEGFAEPLREQAAQFGELASRLAEVSEHALRHHRKELLERELVVARLANTGIELYAIASVLARASQATTDRGEEAAADDLLLARTFTVDAVRRVRRELRAAEDASGDDATRAVAARAIDAKGYPIRS